MAELDLGVYNAPQNETFAKLNIDQVNDIGQGLEMISPRDVRPRQGNRC
ncbi:MAG: hypothetical protein WAK17_06915 [Candidatus Nitrosopolaris sp.]